MNVVCVGYERNPGSIGCRHCQKLKKDHKLVAVKPVAKTTTAPKPFVGNPFDPAVIAAHHDAVAAAPWLAGMATAEPEPAPSPRLRVLCVLDGVEADHKVLDHFEDEAARLEDEATDTEEEAHATALFAAASTARRRRAIAEMQLRARLVFSGFALDAVDKDEPIDDVHGEVKVGGEWARVADYDLVFLNNETPSVRSLAAVAELPLSRVAFVANVKAERWDGEGQRRRQVIPATLTAILRRICDLVTDRCRQRLMPWGVELAYPPSPSPDDAAVDEAIVKLAA